MTAEIIYPYRTLVGSELVLRSTDEDLRLRPDGSIDAQQVGDGLSMTLSCEVDLERLGECLSAGERVESVVALVVVAQSITSRRRDVVASGVVDRKMSLPVVLAHDRHRGLVELRARLVRIMENLSPDPARAAAMGELLGESDPIRIHFDEPQTAPGASLDVEWRDFGSDPKLSDQSEHLFAISDGEPPTILLNSGIPKLYPILSNTGPRGRQPKIRDAVFTQIVHQVWSSLLADAAVAASRSRTELLAADQAPDVDVVLDDVGGWRARVLRDWAVDLVGESDADVAVERLVDEMDGGLGRILITDMPAAIQRRLDTMRSFHGLVAEIRLFGD